MVTQPDLLPDPPLRDGSQNPAEFTVAASNLLEALPPMVMQFNQSLTEIVDLVSGVDFNATSTTSLTIGTGTQNLTVETGKLYNTGQYVSIARTSAPANVMYGQVTSYNSGTGALVVEVDDTAGSGTFTDWSVALAAVIVGLTAAEAATLTNKTIALGSNTISGTTAQFNTALTDGSFATLAGSETLSNKTLTRPVGSAALQETPYTITDGASVDIDPANGGIQTWTLGANRTPTATNMASGDSVLLRIADGTAYSVTWSTIGVVWKGGSAPTLATSGYSLIELVKIGSTVYGAYIGDVAS